MPETVFATKPLRFRDRFSYWHDVACKVFVEHDWTPNDRQHFEAEVKAFSFGSAGLSLCRNTAMTIERSPEHAAHAHDDMMFLLVQTAGTCTLRQDGRETTVNRTGMTLLDTQRPYTIRYSDGTGQLIVGLPRRELEMRTGDITHLTATHFDIGRGVGRLAAEFAKSLAQRAREFSAASHPQLSGQISDLLGLALVEPASRNAELSSPRTISLYRLKAAIDACLSNTNATCAGIAQAAGISVRYANQLLSPEGTSLERLLWTTRLEKCRSAFDDPHQNRRTISEIAYGWGFGDMTHFGRMFKNRYGLTPRAYRAEAQESGA